MHTDEATTSVGEGNQSFVQAWYMVSLCMIAYIFPLSTALS